MCHIWVLGPQTPKKQQSTLRNDTLTLTFHRQRVLVSSYKLPLQLKLKLPRQYLT